MSIIYLSLNNPPQQKKIGGKSEAAPLVLFFRCKKCPMKLEGQASLCWYLYWPELASVWRYLQRSNPAGTVAYWESSPGVEQLHVPVLQVEELKGKKMTQKLTAFRGLSRQPRPESSTKKHQQLSWAEHVDRFKDSTQKKTKKKNGEIVVYSKVKASQHNDNLKNYNPSATFAIQISSTHLPAHGTSQRMWSDLVVCQVFHPLKWSATHARTCIVILSKSSGR